MVSTFVKNFPGLGTSANRLVERIRTATDGKLRIRLYNANELVGPLEVFDVVSKGDADIYFSSEYYYLGKSKAFGFFGAVPFGLTMDEYYAWLYYGGGQKLWDELSAQFNQSLSYHPTPASRWAAGLIRRSRPSTTSRD
jgi:TRAP-type mannitol/chloroaromatic compound transport system substrate-binding protein